MNVGQAAHFNLGHSPFLYSPTESGDFFSRPITEGTALNAANSDDSQPTREGMHLDSIRPLGANWESTGADQSGNRDHDDNDETCSRTIRARRVRNVEGEVARRDDDSQPCFVSGDGAAGRGEGRELDPGLELQRQRLVENLIGMGFPVEWAVRAAERSGEKQRRWIRPNRCVRFKTSSTQARREGSLPHDEKGSNRPFFVSWRSISVGL